MAKATTEIAEAFTRDDDESYQEYTERKAAERDNDDALLVKAANMNIKRFVPEEKPGVYDDQVDTLIQVDEQTGFQNSIEIAVPSNDAKKHQKYFRDSAKKRGLTARIVNGPDGKPYGDDGTLLEFVLAPKYERKARAGQAASGQNESSANVTEDTPEQAPAA